MRNDVPVFQPHLSCQNIFRSPSLSHRKQHRFRKAVFEGNVCKISFFLIAIPFADTTVCSRCLPLLVDRGKSEHHRTGCRPRALLKSGSTGLKTCTTDSATENRPLRNSGVRVKRWCKRPPDASVMAHAWQTSPMQG